MRLQGGNVDKNPVQKTRQAIYGRLANFDYVEEQLRDKSLYQLVTLLQLLAGGGSYIGTYFCACDTLAQIFGDEVFYAKPLEEPKVEEKPGIVVH
jgi:hypothetical protein